MNLPSKRGRIAGGGVGSLAPPHITLGQLQIVVLGELVLLLHHELLAVVAGAEAPTPEGVQRVLDELRPPSRIL
jgi:hypothetical protein